MQSGDNLLNLAMRSLKTDAEQEKRSRLFASNQKAIDDIKNSVENVVGNLRIKPNIQGESDTQMPQPLVQGESYEIDLNKMILPSQMGGGTLKAAIERLCSQNNIKIESTEKVNSALLTPVATALAGRHAEDDKACEGVTKAEFVPVFDSGWEEKRVLALSFSLNGETGLRTDLLKVRGNMTCLGRASFNSTALQAIEIPNQLSMQLATEKPELLHQLQKNACLVAFVEFDLIPSWAQDSSYVRSKGLSRGFEAECTRGEGTRGGLTGEVESSSNSGLSAYAVIGQGSHVLDHSKSVVESGIRKLSKVSLYIVGAMVVNTHEQVLTQEQRNILVKMMQLRVQELSTQYETCKIYNYNSFLTEINTYLEKYHIDSHNTDIFEHSILQLGLIRENPSECHFSRNPQDPQSTIMSLGLPFPVITQLVNNLRSRFGNDFCDYAPFDNRYNTFAIRFSLPAIKQQMDLIKQSIDGILSDPRHLQAYQRYTRREESLYNTFMHDINRITREVGLSPTRDDCVETVLSQMFGCKEELHTARFMPGESYVGKMIDTHFFLDISESAARQLIENVNREFPNYYAKFLRANARLADKGNVDFCEMVIDTNLLCSSEFQLRFKATLDDLIENNPLLIEKLRRQSGTQTKSSSEYADKLRNVAQQYQAAQETFTQSAEVIQPKHQLAESLVKFSSILTNPMGKRSERLAASDEVRRSVALLESNQTAAENEQFKQEDKKLIKETQRSLYLRR